MKSPSDIHLIDDAAAVSTAMNPLRMKLLSALREPNSASGLASLLDESRQKINYHVRRLESDGLIQKVDERKARGCTEVIMQTVARAFLVSPAALGGVGAEPKDVKDRASSSYLMAAAAEIIRDLGVLRRAADQEDKRLATATLESTVTFCDADAQRRFGDELVRAVADLVSKYDQPECEDGRKFRLFTGVYQDPANLK